MKISSQLQAPADLPPWEQPDITFGQRAILDVVPGIKHRPPNT
jgi:hypothetical protein